MDIGGFNPVDLAILAVLVVSGLLALLRGFAKEVLSIVGWVAGVVATLHLFPLLKPFAASQIENATIANVVVIGVTFIVVMIAISLLTTFIAKKVNDSRLGPLDRALGFVFGLLRGAILVSAGYLVMLWLQPDARKHPDVVRSARALPLVVDASAILAKAVPKDMRPKVPDSADIVRKAVDGAANAAGETLKSLQDAVESGYKSKDRGLLDQLIESAGQQRQ